MLVRYDVKTPAVAMSETDRELILTQTRSTTGLIMAGVAAALLVLLVVRTARRDFAGGYIRRRFSVRRDLRNRRAR